jgi:hypothetical protein
MENLKLSKIISRLEKMNGPTDGKGVYLGDGVTPGEPIRAKEIAEYLRELQNYRNLTKS